MAQVGLFSDITENHSNKIPIGNEVAALVRPTPAQVDRVSFAKVLASGVDSDWGSVVKQGSGQTVSQANGNLLVTTGTTVNAETIIRSNKQYGGSGIRIRTQVALSQRISNQSFFVELVDVIQDAAAITINSATSVTVTFATNPFDASNVGQAMYLGGYTGTGTFIPGRYTIASVAGNTVNYTVAGFAAGSGTCSVFGWSYYHVLYDGTSATSAKFDTQRKGWAAGDNTISISSTGSPGHAIAINSNDMFATLMDTSQNSSLNATRATRNANVPDDIKLYAQIRVVNSSAAPASTTTLTVNYFAVSEFSPLDTTIQDVRPLGTSTSVPMQITGGSVGQTTGANSTIWNAAGFAGFLVADVASGAITSTTTTSSITPSSVANIGTYSHEFNVVVTAVSGTNPTLDISIQESPDNGTNWYTIYEFERITAQGVYASPLIRAQFGTRFRYVQTVGGTSPSFTRAINRVQFSAPGQMVRRFMDRSIVLTTLNSTTPAYLVDGCGNIELLINIGAATTPPTIQLQGSEDGSNWYAIGSALAAVASSTVRQVATNEMPKFVRAIVSSAGSAVTTGYVCIKGTGTT